MAPPSFTGFSFFADAEEVQMKDDVGHKGIITYATHITLANGADRYVTCSRDGMVKVWNAKVRYEEWGTSKRDTSIPNGAVNKNGTVK